MPSDDAFVEGIQHLDVVGGRGKSFRSIKIDAISIQDAVVVVYSGGGFYKIPSIGSGVVKSPFAVNRAGFTFNLGFPVE